MKNITVAKIKKLLVISVAIAMLAATVYGCVPGPAETTPAPSDAPQTPLNVTATPSAGASENPNASDAPTESALTDAPTDPALSAAPSGEVTRVSIGTGDKPALNTMPTELYGVSVSECEAWFSDAVFIGDSITIGWKNYNNKMLESDPNFFGKTRFLCEGSYGAGHALDRISDKSLHPIYAGEQHYIWDSIGMMNAKKVFLLFGMNDLGIYGVDGTFENYSEVIDNIISNNPGVEIYIISSMYMYKGSEKPKLNNANLYMLNRRLAKLCNEKGYEFLNIASHLIDEDGFIVEKYSSDKYVHQTQAAYAVWAEVLRSVAARHIKGMPAVEFIVD